MIIWFLRVHVQKSLLRVCVKKIVVRVVCVLLLAHQEQEVAELLGVHATCMTFDVVSRR